VEKTRIKDLNINNDSVKSINQYELNGNSEFLEIIRTRNLLIKSIPIKKKVDKSKLKRSSSNNQILDYKTSTNDLLQNIIVYDNRLLNKNFTTPKKSLLFSNFKNSKLKTYTKFFNVSKGSSSQVSFIK